MSAEQTERVERARGGDRDAFNLLAAAAVDRLYAVARLVLRDADRAEDAVQETLVRCWRDLPSLRDPSRYRDMTSLIRHVVELLREGRMEEAAAVDRAIDVLNGDLEGFERANQLTACP